MSLLAEMRHVAIAAGVKAINDNVEHGWPAGRLTYHAHPATITELVLDAIRYVERMEAAEGLAHAIRERGCGCDMMGSQDGELIHGIRMCPSCAEMERALDRWREARS